MKCKTTPFGATVLWAYTHPGQMVNEQDYPYLNMNTNLTCPKDIKKFKSNATVLDALNDFFCDEEKLKHLVVKYGAVETGMFSNDESFHQHRTGEIYQSCSSKNLTHSVVVVGYGVENEVPFWKVKNSWGTNWGDKGFFRIIRGRGECGIGTTCTVAKCGESLNNNHTSKAV